MKKAGCFLLGVIIFWALAPVSVWAQCSEADGIPPECDRSVLCYSPENKAFFCCGDYEEATDPDGVAQCTSIVGNVSENYTAEQCQEVNNLLGEEVSLSYISVLHACVDFSTFLNTALQWAILLAALLALVRLGTGILQYILATGDPTKLEDARTTIMYAVAGLLIIGIAYVILRLGAEFIPESWGWGMWFGTR
ncbi:hypothetical protein B5M47_02355 [candidate division CPR3 bacterium 4484_211]|uniref:Uncharacterized protein n=1 Tax=candidate division CPR3 bacterium 4484_211 TaxID=1968527 RepID=A0A1W9NXV0_UNCC3|nr:MAG: hypothetical protein B5M47_02355 [candidate division CPR3 bacterium 4484_211]